MFSADELRAADPEALIFGLGWAPPLTADERDFVRSYSQSKLASIREQLELRNRNQILPSAADAWPVQKE